MYQKYQQNFNMFAPMFWSHCNKFPKIIKSKEYWSFGFKRRYSIQEVYKMVSISIKSERYVNMTWLKIMIRLICALTLSVNNQWWCDILDYEWKSNLRLVRIYFDTPTFDRITKDRAAKFMDVLSAIGGTMGLLTGFSIISGVEILYFVVKFSLNLVGKAGLKANTNTNIFMKPKSFLGFI